MALTAFASHTAAAAIGRYLLPTAPTVVNLHQRVCCCYGSVLGQTGGQTDRQTNGQTPCRFVDPASRTMRAVPVMKNTNSVMLLQQYHITCHVYSYLNGLINLLLWNIVAVIVFILIIKLHQCRTIVYCYAKDHFKRKERNNNVQLHCYIICCFLHDAIVGMEYKCVFSYLRTLTTWHCPHSLPRLQ